MSSMAPAVERLSSETRTRFRMSSSAAVASAEAAAAAKPSRNPLKGAVGILRDRLYYVALKSKPTQESTTKRCADGTKKTIHYFSIDDELVYWNFFLDFGPLNLGQLYRFCTILNKKLVYLPNHIICFYSNSAPAKRANGICLICCWQLLYLNRNPEEAFAGFRPITNASAEEKVSGNSSLPPIVLRNNPTVNPLPSFHDASPCPCTYELTVMDCLKGLAKARSLGFFDFDNFDVEEYEHFEQVENGDLNWIVYGKILAFAGPSYERRVSPEGYCTLSPADYIPYFKEKNVSLVVRLNRKAYNEQDFLDAGIDHLEQFYVDGSCPPIKILDRVVEAFDKVPENKAFAVHCKAGLGRTGTCIGAYLMKHYRFTASEVIAWMRICRPGMVIGPQQQFLKEIEQRMWQMGTKTTIPTFRKSIFSDLTFNCLSVKHEEQDDEGILCSSTGNDEAVVGRAGQAEALLRAHRNRSSKPQKETPPPSPGAVQSTNAVTPDPPGKSQCDGTRWFI